MNQQVNTTNMQSVVLNVENLHVYYGAIHALKGVSLSVCDKEIVTLIGANGAGKSTLLRTISGLLPMKEGKVFHKNTSLNNIPSHLIVERGISQVPEGRRVFANMSVKENLDLGAFLRNDKAEIASDIEHVYRLFPRLKERIHQSAGTLSGGEQQMLAMGRALMARPSLLLLDEPSMGLAPLLVKEIFRIITEINKQGVTILLVEQNAHMSLSIANRAYVLETGSIVLEGPAGQVAQMDEVKKAYLGE